MKQSKPVFVCQECGEWNTFVEERVSTSPAAVSSKHPTLAGVRRSLDRMPEETQSQVKQHIAAWRDSQQERWAGYLLEDLAGMRREHGATAS